ncbi:MAG: hypothetical protein PWP23_473 [Candidatus Sumerlaeota bacterium]|nr:hypothetical protein [Candidatus Sumerlaeota bacterium]
MKASLLATLLLATAPVLAVTPDATSLMGIHWYPNTDALSVGQATDVETMADNTGVWITEITHVNTAAAPAWVQPSYFVSHTQKAAQGKGHSFVFRLQPYWNCNVPHPDDPYTNAQFAADAKSAAQTLKDFVHIWQVGNEVNIKDENRRWNAGSNDYSGAQWTPTPEQYAATYVAVRDKIHEASADVAPADQIVLMQPVSPGPADTYRFMDGNEFLYRMIDAVADKSKIDGFGLHAYAEPGGANYGYDGFFDSLREQIMIIDSFGLGDRPLVVTEFNKHMPNATEANIGAKFLHRAYQNVADWNAASGGTLPGLPNHNIVGMTWFVYPSNGWDDYSLLRWKTDIASTDKELNPWYSFQYAAQQNHPAGQFGGGPTSIPQGTAWFEDTFDGSTVDQTAPLPDWKVEPVGSGTATASGGHVLLRGNNSNFGGCSIRTAGYAFSDFALETNVTLNNAARASTATGEANFEVRIREGSSGYSLTFFTADSQTNANTIILRRVNNWGENIGGFQTTVGGNGIATGDSFRILITAMGTELKYEVYENDAAAPIVNWTVTDGGQRTGLVRIGTYNLNELAVDNVVIGGPYMNSTASVKGGWTRYN